MPEAKSPHVVIMTTIGARTEASKLAMAAVEARVAACVQMLPVHSVYRWQGEIETAEEWQLLLKTSGERLEDAMTFLRRHHPYVTPEIIVLPIIAGSRDYLAWIDENTG